MKISCSHLALLLLLMASAVFAQSIQEVEPDAKTREALDVFADGGEHEGEKAPEEIQEYFRRLGEATRSEKKLKGASFLSMEALLEAAKDSGALDDFSEEQLSVFEKVLPASVDQMGESMKMMAYDRFKILKVETLEGGGKLVSVRHYDNDLNLTFPMRWWLTQREGKEGYLCYDFEEMSMGLRTAQMFAIGAAAGIEKRASPPWLLSLTLIVNTMQQNDLADPDIWLEIEKPVLQLAADQGTPKELQTFANIMRVNLHLNKGDTQAANADLARIREEGIDVPIWHYLKGNVLMVEENYDEALEEFASHAKFLGWDSDTLELVADCYYYLEDYEKARAAAVRGLKDNPSSWACAASWAASSTTEQLQTESARVFGTASNLEELYESSLDYLLDLEESEKAKVLFSVFKKEVNESDLFDYYQEVFDDLEGE